MSLPTPVYRIKFNGNYLSGYVQDEDVPLAFKINSADNLGSNGGFLSSRGAGLRSLTLTMRVLSRLSTSATALQHLQDCEDQIIDSINYLITDTPQKLYVGRTTRYIMAQPKQVGMPKAAGDDSKRQTYTVEFTVQPFFLDDTPLTATATGNTTLTVTFSTYTSKTYPVFSIPSGVTAALFTYAGKTLTFTRGVVSGALTIDCGKLTATLDSTGVSVIQTITEVNWGFSFTGTGAFSVVLTGYSGSGTITMTVPQRYPR